MGKPITYQASEHTESQCWDEVDDEHQVQRSVEQACPLSLLDVLTTATLTFRDAKYGSVFTSKGI